MASYTAIPYATIVAASIVPAILYFLSVAFMVRIEAVKYDAGSDLDMTVDKGKLLSGGLVFVIPLTVMIWLLLSGVTSCLCCLLGNCRVNPYLLDNKPAGTDDSKTLV